MQPSSRSFTDRIVGVLRLEPAAFEDVEHDTEATMQAAAVVAVASILSGIGAAQNGLNGLIGGVISSLVVWAIYALFVYIVGTMILKGPDTSADFGQILRPLGFSFAPYAFAVLGIIPAIGGLLAFLAGIWSVIASVIAVRESLEVTTGRAVAIVIVAFIAMVIVLALIVSVLGIGIYGFANMAGAGV